LDLPELDRAAFAHPHAKAGMLDYDDSIAVNRHGALVIGAGIDGQGSLNPHISLASTDAMISTTRERYGKLANVGVTGLWAGLLSDTADHLPIVDRADGSYVNSGHSWGIGSAPICGQTMAEVIAGETSQFASALSADRASLRPQV
jgi:glycine/D-amino acid oxidase-like deaminating enzyme